MSPHHLIYMKFPLHLWQIKNLGVNKTVHLSLRSFMIMRSGLEKTCVSFLLFVPLENFSLIWTRHHYRLKAANFYLCSACTYGHYAVRVLDRATTTNILVLPQNPFRHMVTSSFTSRSRFVLLYGDVIMYQ